MHAFDRVCARAHACACLLARARARLRQGGCSYPSSVARRRRPSAPSLSARRRRTAQCASCRRLAWLRLLPRAPRPNVLPVKARRWASAGSAVGPAVVVVRGLPVRIACAVPCAGQRHAARFVRHGVRLACARATAVRALASACSDCAVNVSGALREQLLLEQDRLAHEVRPRRPQRARDRARRNTVEGRETTAGGRSGGRAGENCE